MQVRVLVLMLVPCVFLILTLDLPHVRLVTAPGKWVPPMPLPSVVTRSGRRMPALPPVRLGPPAPPPVELRGQVTMQTSFGQELHRIAGLPHVHLVLEIGTWYGGGSSWCIAQGLRGRSNAWLITLEMFEEAWAYAAQTLSQLPVTCMRAGTVGPDLYLKPEQMTEEERGSEHYRLYYERDLELAGRTTPMLQTLCRTYDFDFILIDGNEYTGLPEFEIVNRWCRPRYLALHDTGTLKTRRVEEILQQSPDWAKISGGADAAGWAVYEAAH